jgi:hypothetical protein
MVVVMFLGMFTLMAPTGWVLGALGASWSHLSPAMNVFTMALTMTVPMVAWMRYRGHAWRPNVEMAASMLIPTFGVMTLLWAGVSTSGALMVPDHAAMLISMLFTMLLRRDDYRCAGHRIHKHEQQRSRSRLGGPALGSDQQDAATRVERHRATERLARRIAGELA